MIIFKTKKKIKLTKEHDADNLFSLSGSGWNDAIIKDDFNPEQFSILRIYGDYNIPGNKQKGYKKIKRKDIEVCINIGCLDNKVMHDKKLLKLVWSHINNEN